MKFWQYALWRIVRAIVVFITSPVWIPVMIVCIVLGRLFEQCLQRWSGMYRDWQNKEYVRRTVEPPR